MAAGRESRTLSRFSSSVRGGRVIYTDPFDPPPTASTPTPGTLSLTKTNSPPSNRPSLKKCRLLLRSPTAWPSTSIRKPRASHRLSPWYCTPSPTPLPTLAPTSFSISQALHSQPILPPRPAPEVKVPVPVPTPSPNNPINPPSILPLPRQSSARKTPKGIKRNSLISTPALPVPTSAADPVAVYLTQPQVTP